MAYRKLFDPAAAPRRPDAGAERMGDRAAVPYIYTDRIVLAVNLALATRRPLLVRGSSGVGKSALARDIARLRGWRFVEIQMTSRTEAQDLLWRFDALRRLQDAQLGTVQEIGAYVTPGPLWWAFDSASATRQYDRAAGKLPEPGGDAAEPAVLLIDEIDKADPDIPNNLLTVLGNLAFEVEPLREVVQVETVPLIVITTNDERDLPAAFVRRCIELNVESPDAARLREIGITHFPAAPADLLAQVADKAVRTAAELDLRVSTAEFLDLLQACIELGVGTEDPEWVIVMGATFSKPKGRGAGL